MGGELVLQSRIPAVFGSLSSGEPPGVRRNRDVSIVLYKLCAPLSRVRPLDGRECTRAVGELLSNCFSQNIL